RTALGNECRNPLRRVAECFQLTVETVLHRDNGDAGRQSRQYRGVVVTLGAQPDDFVGIWAPVVEGNEVRRPPRAAIDRDSVRPPAPDLGGVGLTKGALGPPRGERVAAGAPDPAGADDRHCVHASAYPLIYSFRYPSNSCRCASSSARS